MDCFDYVSIRAQDFPQCRYLHLQVAFVDYDGGPDAAYNLRLRNNSAGRTEQYHQQIKGAPSQVDWVLIEQQLASVRQHPESSETNNRVATAAYFI
jgi:hypothetical protein